MYDRLHTTLATLLLLVILSTTSALALSQDAPPTEQQTTPPETTTPPEETASPLAQFDTEAIQKRIGELQQLNQEDEAVKAELDLLRRTLSALQEYAADQEAIKSFKERANSAPDRLKQLQEELAIPIEESIPALPTDATLQDLTGLLQTTQNELDAAKKRRTDIENETTNRTTRLTNIPDLIAKTTESLDAIDDSLQTPADPNNVSTMAQARLQNLQARKAALQIMLERLNEETKSYNARSDMIRLRRDRAQRQVTVGERSVQQLQEVVDKGRQVEAQRTQQEADAARSAAANEHPVIRAIIETTATFAQENSRVTEENSQRSAEKTEITQLITYWNEELDRFRKQEETIGLDEVMGLRLRSLQLKLPNRRVLGNQLLQLKTDLQKAQGEAFGLDSSRILDQSSYIETRMSESETPIRDAQKDDIKQGATTALSAQTAMRNDLQNTYDMYLKTLTSQYQDTQELISLVNDLNFYIDQHVLWIQSANPIGIADLGQGKKAVVYLFNPENWLAVYSMYRSDVGQRWPLYLAFLLVFASSLILRRRLRKTLLDAGKHVSRVTSDRFSYTLKALLYTLLMAMVWPMLLWFLSWRLGQTPVFNDFVAACSKSLGRVGTLFFFICLTRLICLPKGLADAHFHWNVAGLARIRHQLNWITPIILPLAFTTILLQDVAHDTNRDSFGRLSFMIAMILIAIFTWRLLHPQQGVFSHHMTRHPGGWIARTKYIWLSILVLSPIGFMVAAAFGYVYTAVELDRKMNDTVALLLLVLIVHNLLLRWLVVVQRKLAVGQAKKKRAAALAALKAEAVERAKQGEEASASSMVDSPPPIEEETIDVAAISVQTHRMLTSVVIMTSILLVMANWADVLPAFQFLNDIQFAGMTTTQMVGGEMVLIPITMADFTRFLIVIIITFIVNRNLPGLLEIIVLQRLPISSGARYAVVMLARYVVIILGIGAAFDQIGIGWAQVQWLAAAVTVGLGFGLQEIFANFVSGIILLFERPVRVGDTVTVGQISGTVTRIQMRATTITDWDRKELIIPNKEFITGQIINWSLSDSILRLTIPVGIAYGSDTETARRLLLQSAMENDRILDDPAPQSVFCGFGDSSLDFELRVFLPNVDHFVAARHELLNVIDQAFREAHIEIAFPQQDLHIRTVTPTQEMMGDKRVLDVQTSTVGDST
ncbi:MAG: mechanosensitive ion channel [Planctomycetota bacterium]|nr:mechanosensitive ion channel [Planctomycetota bacterium]